MAYAILGAGLLLVVAVACYFVRCAKRGVCPFPHFRKSRFSITSLPAPLSTDDSNRAALLGDLQGNILAGHGRDHAAHLFINFSPDTAAARAWIRQIAEKYVVSAAVQRMKSHVFKALSLDGGIFGHISLSAAGYRALGFPPANFPKPSNPFGRSDNNGYTDVFAAGMKSRQRYLLDPEVTTWDSGYHDEVHAVLILAGDSAEEVNHAVDEVARSLQGTTGGVIGKVVAREDGMGLTRQLDPNDPSTVVNVEHFGFMDGRSQPVFLKEQVDAEKAHGGISTYDPSAPLSLVLVRDPLGKSDFSHGSFLVFRKLEQNVRAWNRAISGLAKELGVKEDLAGAMAMGRFKDGTPVVGQGIAGRTDVHNNFDFAGDPYGRKCPFQAHIRKTNPRGEAVGVDSPTLEAERLHRIVRRGIPYGGPLTTSEVPEEQPQHGVGLLFFCYQSDIWEQFEFIQRRWSNNPFFAQPQKSRTSGYDETGLDPVIGQSHPRAQHPARGAKNWPKGWNEEPAKVTTELANFVTMKGGEYFFSPSMSFLLGL